MKRSKKGENNGYDEWGGYMSAKKTKLLQQFNEESGKIVTKVDDLFKNIAIFVNGYSDPPADDLRRLMMKHGGAYHHYFKNGSTTHIIASNLPDSKIKLANTHKIVKPSWITDSIKAGKLLNYCDYLLITNQSTTQPSLKKLFVQQNDVNEKKRLVKDATQEGFLSEFYNNSRLHHISIMSTIFKDYINNIRNDKTHKLLGREELLKKYPNRENHFHNEKKFIMHIDMDCFFVSVGLRNKPELRGLPVAVTHSNGNQVSARDGVSINEELLAYRKKKENSEKYKKTDEGSSRKLDWASNIGKFDSMAEIASCSYEARKAGIKNGMFVGQAIKLCPNLNFIHYDFDSYKEVSYTLYQTVAKYTIDIEAVSCDEMYADCTPLLNSLSIGPMEFANILRTEIKEKTLCPCSVGFGGNRLQARLATKKAKPDGQYHLNEEELASFMYSLAVSDLPGVGGSTNFKLKCMGIRTCGDLQNASLQSLKEEFGNKLAEALHKNSFGKDDKQLNYNYVRKSVSADVNYGIRFVNNNERDNFLKQLSEEVASRLSSVKMRGRSITLKLMIRSKNAPEETAKYMGHGVCDNISKGISLSTATSSSQVIMREALKLMNGMNTNCKELRGIGIQISRLEPEAPVKNNLAKFLSHRNEMAGNSKDIRSLPKKKKIVQIKKTYEDLSFSQIDQSFLKAMPDDIQREILSNIKGSVRLPQSKEKEESKPSEKLEANIIKEMGENERPMQAERKDVMETYISPSELRSLIKQWVASEDDPLNRDISMISEYLRHLVAADHLEDLLIIIKSFFRCINRNRKSTNWKRAYMKVLEKIQTCTYEKYRSTLIVEDIFPFV